MKNDEDAWPVVEAIDINQENYFEEALPAPCVRQVRTERGEIVFQSQKERRKRGDEG